MGKQNTACLVIHGFTGGPHEVLPLVERLKQEGYTVKVPTLAGHTGNLKDLTTVNYLDWIGSAESVLRNLITEYSKVNIIGFSMGGLIGIYLADIYNINTLTTLSTPIYVGNKRRIVKNIYRGLRHKDYQRMRKYIYNFKNVPLKALLNFKIILVKAKPIIGKVNIPVLILQGLKDDVVNPKSAEYIYQAMISHDKELYYLPESSHVVCCDIEREQVYQLVTRFLNRY